MDGEIPDRPPGRPERRVRLHLAIHRQDILCPTHSGLRRSGRSGAESRNLGARRWGITSERLPPALHRNTALPRPVDPSPATNRRGMIPMAIRKAVITSAIAGALAIGPAFAQNA